MRLELEYKLRRIFTETGDTHEVKEGNRKTSYRYEFYRKPTGAVHETSINAIYSVAFVEDQKWTIGHPLKIVVEI